WYGQSGYPTLCPGERSTATVAYYNAGSLGWVAGRMGEVAYLGTWGPEPGQDRASPLGGDGTNGSPPTGWPRYNRIAGQPSEYVGPGQVAWFQFTIQAPTTPGIYMLGLRPLVEGAQWMEDFGVFWLVTVLNPDGSRPSLVCEDCWPLYGTKVAGGPVGRRGLNVKIDNSPSARPHYGISEADMVFETLVEGYITRLHALLHSQNPGTLGSIRSARFSDRYITPMIRGGLSYSGATDEETFLIRQDHGAGRFIDLNANYLPGLPYYYRTTTRASPFNMFTSSDAMRQALNDAGGGAPVAIPRWEFVNNSNLPATLSGMNGSGFATTITIPYRSRATVRYQYDAATRGYARWQDNGAGAMVREVDAANGVAIAAKNVVIIHTEVWETEVIQDIFGSRGLDMRLRGSGVATVFRDGRRQDGTWHRETDFDAFAFRTQWGEPILLSPGQTWVHVVFPQGQFAIPSQ
ncbi:MAG: DUF3048 domain-containing protein, partial [Candidatus Limnocylindria bacterium]